MADAARPGSSSAGRRVVLGTTFLPGSTTGPPSERGPHRDRPQGAVFQEFSAGLIPRHSLISGTTGSSGDVRKRSRCARRRRLTIPHKQVRPTRLVQPAKRYAATNITAPPVPKPLQQVTPSAKVSSRARGAARLSSPPQHVGHGGDGRRSPSDIPECLCYCTFAEAGGGRPPAVGRGDGSAPPPNRLPLSCNVPVYFSPAASASGSRCPRCPLWCGCGGPG